MIEETWTKGHQFDKEALWATYYTLNFVGSILCFLVMLGIYKFKNKNAGDIFAAGLCFGCFTMSVSCASQCLLNAARGRGYFSWGPTACDVEAMFHVSSITMQALSVLAVSLCNYFTIVRRTPISVRAAWLSVLGIAALSYASVAALGRISDIYLMPAGAYCFYKFDSPLILGFFGPVLALAMAATAYCYFRIFRTAKTILSDSERVFTCHVQAQGRRRGSSKGGQQDCPSSRYQETHTDVSKEARSPLRAGATDVSIDISQGGRNGRWSAEPRPLQLITWNKNSPTVAGVGTLTRHAHSGSGPLFTPSFNTPISAAVAVSSTPRANASDAASRPVPPSPSLAAAASLGRVSVAAQALISQDQVAGPQDPPAASVNATSGTGSHKDKPAAVSAHGTTGTGSHKDSSARMLTLRLGQRSVAFVLVFVLGWGPAIVLCIHELSYGSAPEVLDTLLGTFGSMHSVFVPLIYGYLNPRLRNTIMCGWGGQASSAVDEPTGDKPVAQGAPEDQSSRRGANTPLNQKLVFTVQGPTAPVRAASPLAAPPAREE